MEPKEIRREKAARVAEELGGLLRRQAHEKWARVRMARRNEGGRHVWRFRTGPGQPERFLYVSRTAMQEGENPSQAIFERLQAGRWLDRLHEGPETALHLSRGGKLRPWPLQH